MQEHRIYTTENRRFKDARRFSLSGLFFFLALSKTGDLQKTPKCQEEAKPRQNCQLLNIGPTGATLSITSIGDLEPLARKTQGAWTLAKGLYGGWMDERACERFPFFGFGKEGKECPVFRKGEKLTGKM